MHAVQKPMLKYPLVAYIWEYELPCKRSIDAKKVFFFIHIIVFAVYCYLINYDRYLRL